jgi:1-deoxy-D-xylulose-5-phosphate reductoisomerase
LPAVRPRRVAVLGSTGSIGTSALAVAEALPDRLQIVGLAARTRWAELADQCRRVRPRVAVLTDPEAFAAADRSAFPPETELLCGDEAACALARAADVDVVLAAVVGAAGLDGTWAALEAGKTVALANKESLVIAGGPVTELAAERGGRLLPVDSEHSAIFQALGDTPVEQVARVILTASGGPFRGRSLADLEHVTPEQALRHPTWRMGPKVTIDSATLMNKALEVIEARWLFDLPADKLDAIVHPESVVHSFVEFVDGSVLAQMSPPDMKLPIQHALTHPGRVPGPAKKLDWQALRGLCFEPPDRGTFPALDLGFEAVRRGGTCGAVLNAANEAAVERFLGGTIGFNDIPRCARAALDAHDYDPGPTLAALRAADRRARQEVARWTTASRQTTRSSR